MSLVVEVAAAGVDGGSVVAFEVVAVDAEGGGAAEALALVVGQVVDVAQADGGVDAAGGEDVAEVVPRVLPGGAAVEVDELDGGHGVIVGPPVWGRVQRVPGGWGSGVVAPRVWPESLIEGG